MDEHWREALRTIRSLQTQLRLADEKIQQLQRQVDRARARARRHTATIDELESELASVPDKVAGARQDALKVQALRARLAKTDMNPAARLRTLRAARDAGIALTPEQLVEFYALPERCS